MNFVFFNWNTIKKETEISAVYNHNERQKEAYLSNPNIRKEYTNQNYHFKRPEASYWETIQIFVEKFHIKVRSSTTLMIDGVITPSSEWIIGKSCQQQMEFFFRAYEYIKSRFTERNILSTVVHMDEDTPHMHFDIVPVTPDYRMSSGYFFPYPEGKLIEMNMFYEHIHSYYPDISRGMPCVMADKDRMAMKYYKVAPDYYEMNETMWKAINSLEGKGKELQEKKDWTMALYTAVSKMASYTIVMQEGEINYYKKKLIPHLLEELRVKEKRIEELSELEKESSKPEKNRNTKKNPDKEMEHCAGTELTKVSPVRKHMPFPIEGI